MKIIIVGGGEVGFNIGQRLASENQDVVLIDKDPAKIKRINENLDVQAILGSGTSPEMLKRSGIKETDILVAVTDSDEVNLIACLLARNLNQSMIKIARIRNREYMEEQDLFKQDLLGIDQIINPESVLVDTIHKLMKVPGASDVIDFEDGRLNLIGIPIKEDFPLVGRKLLSLKGLESQMLIGTIIRGDQAIIPHGRDIIMAHDIIYVIALSDALHEVFNAFHMKEEELKRVLIVGAGDIGTGLATVLDKTNIHTKVIEKEGQKCINLAEELKNVIVINGDGTDRSLLKEENINEIDYVVSLTDDDESNVLISLLARSLGAKRCITRINKLSYLPIISAIGIDPVVNPRLTVVRAILQYIRKGKIISVTPLRGEQVEAIEAEVLETSDIVDIPLSERKFPKGTLIGAIIRGDEIMIPRGDTIIRPKDRLIIFVLHEQVRKLEELLTVKLEYF